MTSEEKRFIRALRSNEDWAVRILIDRITPLIKSKIFSFQDWEDACQQCVMEILEAVRNIRKIKNFWGLTRKITITSVIDYNRRYRTTSSRISDPSRRGADDGTDRMDMLKDPGCTQDAAYESRDLFLYIFQRLGKECQKIINLIFIQEINYEDAASQLNISEGNLRVRIHRCKKRAVQIRNFCLAG